MMFYEQPIYWNRGSEFDADYESSWKRACMVQDTTAEIDLEDALEQLVAPA